MDQGQWMTLIFDIHTGSFTHLVNCIYQLWHQGQPRVIIWTNLVAYQVSRSSAFWFQKRWFFKIFTIYGHGSHLGHVASAQSDQSLRCPHEETLGPSYPLSAQWRIWSDWADAKAHLSLRWAHMPFYWFCNEAAQLLKPVMFVSVLLCKCSVAFQCASCVWPGM